MVNGKCKAISLFTIYHYLDTPLHSELLLKAKVQ